MTGLCTPSYSADLSGADVSVPEYFQFVSHQPLRSLLPDDFPCAAGGTFSLVRGAHVNGVAGAGTPCLGGWCSYRCELAVPRRFAAAEGESLAAGLPAEELIRNRIRREMQRIFLSQADRAAAHSGFRADISRRLRRKLQSELMHIGWQLTSFRLENILITRSDNA